MSAVDLAASDICVCNLEWHVAVLHNHASGPGADASIDSCFTLSAIDIICVGVSLSTTSWDNFHCVLLALIMMVRV